MEIKEAINIQISEAQDVYQTFKNLNKEEQELFLVISLNTKNRIVNTHISSIGTLNCASIHPRDVFREAIRNNANSIIIVHNHPSGDSEPSTEDEQVTEKLFEAGELLGVKVLDHVVIGKESYYSFQENKL